MPTGERRWCLEAVICTGMWAAPHRKAQQLCSRQVQPCLLALLIRRPSLCLLLPCSQVELRLLAHLSQDAQLLRLLTLAGAAGDVFTLIARQWLAPGGQQLPGGRAAAPLWKSGMGGPHAQAAASSPAPAAIVPGRACLHIRWQALQQAATTCVAAPSPPQLLLCCSGGAVTREQREAAKRVCYGICYGWVLPSSGSNLPMQRLPAPPPPPPHGCTAPCLCRQSAWGLAEQLTRAQQPGAAAVSVAAAQRMLDAFLAGELAGAGHTSSRPAAQQMHASTSAACLAPQQPRPPPPRARVRLCAVCSLPWRGCLHGEGHPIRLQQRVRAHAERPRASAARPPRPSSDGAQGGRAARREQHCPGQVSTCLAKGSGTLASTLTRPHMPHLLCRLAAAPAAALPTSSKWRCCALKPGWRRASRAARCRRAGPGRRAAQGAAGRTPRLCWWPTSTTSCLWSVMPTQRPCSR